MKLIINRLFITLCGILYFSATSLYSQTILNKDQIKDIGNQVYNIDNERIDVNEFNSLLQNNTSIILITSKICMPCIPKLQDILIKNNKNHNIVYVMLLKNTPLEIDSKINSLIDQGISPSSNFYFIYEKNIVSTNGNNQFLSRLIHDPSPLIIQKIEGDIKLYDVNYTNLLISNH